MAVDRVTPRKRRPGRGRLLGTLQAPADFYISQYSEREQCYTVWRRDQTNYFAGSYGEALRWIKAQPKTRTIYPRGAKS